jgi:TolB-like protein/DNA-binding winged helix-turn-helix (wHTH) protein
VYNVTNTLSKQQAAMDSSRASAASVLGFGVFELDCRAGELRKSGVLVHLAPQPFKVLSLLASHPGRVVTREDIRQQVWGDETYVDFEHGLNHCVTQIRAVLGDDAEAPRYIETLPRRGYRFIYRVTTASVAAASESETAVPDGQDSIGANLARGWERKAFPYKFFALATAGVVLILAAVVAFNVAGLRNRILGRATGPPIIHSIAVLPLENLSRDPEQEYFAEGMTEELITTLGKISALRVISRTSVMRYKGTQKPLPEIARELNVDAIVEGTVERSGNRVRVTANLLYAPADRHLWSESYERDLGDVLSLQDDVARAIVEQIRAKLTPEERLRLAARRPVNPEALEAYLKGRFHWYRVTPGDLETALEYLRLALQKDPNFAPAYAGVGYVWLIRGSWGIVPPKKAIVKGKKSVLRALKMDNTLAEAHATAAGLAFYYDWDWREAEKEYQRAIELNPNYADARAIFWDLLTTMRRPDDATTQIKRAVELDPYNSLFQALLGQHLMFLHRDDQAIAQLRKSLGMESGNSVAHRYLWGALHAKGLQREALAEAKTYLEMMGNHGATEALTQGYAEGGYRQAMRLAAEELAARSRQAYVPCLRIARLYAHAGEKARALKWLEKSFQAREPFMVSLNADPFWDSLRSDPRFQDLLRRMNFPK